MNLSKYMNNVKILIKSMSPNKLYLELLPKYLNIRNFHLSKRYSIKIMEQEWDYLILLDACRFDLFKLVVDDNARFVISGGCSTQEWAEWNFKGNHQDVIYIAGNPHLSTYNLSKTFRRVPFFKV